MSKSLMDKRIVFKKDKQKLFLKQAKEKSNLSWTLFARKIRVHSRTLNGWKREDYLLPLSALKQITKIVKIKMPKSIKLREQFWYTKKGGEIGGKIVYEKYKRIGGNPNTRRQKWWEWWESTGKFNLNKHFVPKEIKIPKKDDDFAEFVGIMLGDGGITERQITITLNSKDDVEYSNFVINLVKNLFGVSPGIYAGRKDSTIRIVISRTNLVKFCVKVGLKKGDKLKQGLDIPVWIKGKKSFKMMCVRGLMDTDGCIFNECHNINGKKYCYPRLSLVSVSRKLRGSVFTILKELGFSPKMRNNRSVQLENRDDIKRYFDIIGSSNPKHIKRFRSYT